MYIIYILSPKDPLSEKHAIRVFSSNKLFLKLSVHESVNYEGTALSSYKERGIDEVLED